MGEYNHPIEELEEIDWPCDIANFGTATNLLSLHTH
jgi:hypothetical protein